MIEVPENPFFNLSQVIEKYEKRIEYIASGGINRSINYEELINGFKKKLEKGIDLFETEVSLTELVYVANEMAVNKDFTKEILEYEEEFESVLLLFQRYKKLSIYKNLLKTYFNHFSLLSETPEKIKILEKYIKDFLFNYDGKNRLINHYKSEKENIFKPINLLVKNEYNVDKIQKQFSLLEDYEYILIMLNFKLIQRLESLYYDEKNEELFEELIQRKDLFFKDNYTLKEYAVKHLLTRAIKEGGLFNNWQQFILEIIGDPRSSSIYSLNRSSWNTIGEDLKAFFIGTLSKEDLKLFLEQLSEKGDIKNYEYRKSFWMAFSEYVQFVKLMVGREVLSLLPPETQNKIKKDENCYATYNQNEQSAIYIDFGKIKIIEYTHNGSVRGYSECPIKLSKHNYSQQELISYKYNVFTEPHLSPATYNWQEKVLKHMNNYLGTNVQIEDIYIEKDKNRSKRYSSYTRTNDNNTNNGFIKCNKCGVMKPSTEFRKNPKTSNGYNYWCISCMDR